MIKILDFLRRCNKQIHDLLPEFDNRLRKMFDGDVHRTELFLKKLEARDKKRLVDLIILLIQDDTMYNSIQSTRGVWKTLKTEEYDEEVIIKKLQLNGHRITEMSVEMIQKVTSQVIVKEIDLVKIKPRDLYFKRKTPISQIFEKAKQLGYELCAPEVGPLLRILYVDQPEKENLYIGMKPIMASDKKSHIYTIERFGKTPIIGDFPLRNEYEVFDLDDTFIFVLPRE
jgi:hypothetical protein